MSVVLVSSVEHGPLSAVWCCGLRCARTARRRRAARRRRRARRTRPQTVTARRSAAGHVSCGSQFHARCVRKHITRNFVLTIRTLLNQCCRLEVVAGRVSWVVCQCECTECHVISSSVRDVWLLTAAGVATRLAAAASDFYYSCMWVPCYNMTQFDLSEVYESKLTVRFRIGRDKYYSRSLLYDYIII